MFKQTLIGFTCFLAGLLIAVGKTSQAGDYYLTAGIGESRLQHPQVNGWWIQQGFDYTIREKANTWKLGAGKRLNKYVSVEADFHKFGDFNMYAGFIADEEHYNPNSPTLCDGPCSPTKWAYLRGSAHAFSANIIGTYPLTPILAVRGRIGYAYYEATFEMYASPYDPMGKKWEEGFARFDQKGFSPVYGLGVSLWNFVFEYNKFPGVQANGGACCSAYQAASEKTISYVWTF